MPAFKETKYTKMLNQHIDVIFTSPVVVKDEIEIYSFEFNGVKRYYAKLDDILVKHFGLSGNGNVKSKYSNGKIFFPQMIRAKKKGFNKYHNFYIELTEEAFKISGYHTLRENPTVAKYLMEDINKMSNANIINEISEKPVVDNDSKEMVDESVQIVEEIVTEPVQIVEETVVEPVQTAEEEITINGQLPLNYNELIDSLQLKENYGKIVANDLENSIKTIFTNAQYSIKVPVREVTKEVTKIVEKESSKTTAYEALHELLKEKMNEIDNYLKSIENKLYLFDPSKIHDFVNAVEKGCISLNTDKSISPNYLRNRLKQVACFMEYTDPKYKEEYPDESILRLVKAEEINKAKPGTFYLGDELVAKFLVSNIKFSEANYDYSNNNYIPLLNGKYDDGTLYYGLIDRKNYVGMLSQNMTILYPGLQQSEIRIIHYDTLINYCNRVIRLGSK